MNPATLRQRPIYGGVFGQGRYALASVPCVARGLHAVRYMVVEPQGGSVLSVADEKAAALAAARRMLERLAASEEPAANESASTQALLWPDEPLPVATPLSFQQQVSRRRREVFDRCDGHCHYCGLGLELIGPWEVEHMKPRALGGTDSPWNLVAACVPCNRSKRDRTALEFVAGQRSL